MKWLLLCITLCGCSCAFTVQSRTSASSTPPVESLDDPRFEYRELGLLSGGWRTQLIVDTKSGAQYMVVVGTGIIKLEPEKK